jgi:predicted cobalt transporter CbtA
VGLLSAPPELTRDFVRAAYIANAILWLSLGGLFATFYKAETR